MRLSLGEGSTIELVEGDITRQSVDAIVNAANSSLMGGGGVDGAIHRAGGRQILEECRKIVAEHGSLPAGRAVSTTGGQLPAGYVIHTVGPVWYGGDCGEPETLASCYRESLSVADKLHLTNIAFPSISTGVYGYPVERAAEVALKSIAITLPDLRYIRDVRFVLFSNADFKTYTRALESLAATKPERYRIDVIRGENHNLNLNRTN